MNFSSSFLFITWKNFEPNSVSRQGQHLNCHLHWIAADGEIYDFDLIWILELEYTKTKICFIEISNANSI